MESLVTSPSYWGCFSYMKLAQYVSRACLLNPGESFFALQYQLQVVLREGTGTKVKEEKTNLNGQWQRKCCHSPAILGKL